MSRPKLSGTDLNVASYEYTIETKTVTHSLPNGIGDVSYQIGISSPRLTMRIWCNETLKNQLREMFLSQKLRLLDFFESVVSVLLTNFSVSKTSINLWETELEMQIVEHGIGHLQTLSDDVEIETPDEDISDDETHHFYTSYSITVSWE